jgi:hypothetical protein
MRQASKQGVSRMRDHHDADQCNRGFEANISRNMWLVRGQRPGGAVSQEFLGALLRVRL